MPNHISIPPDSFRLAKGSAPPSHVVAVRVIRSELRWRKYFDSLGDSSGVSGEEHAIEAKGKISVEIAYQLTGPRCSMISSHNHCTVEMPGHNHEGGKACCLIPEKFPVTIHFAVPLRDPIIPDLGDNLVITIERRPYPLGVEYAHEAE
jgi:hypothetical protein